MSVSVTTSFEMKVLLFGTKKQLQAVGRNVVRLPTSATFKRSAPRSRSGMKGVINRRLAEPP